MRRMWGEESITMSSPFTEKVELTGHIIDSLLLPKVLDCVTAAGGAFRIEKITIGQARKDPSYALVEVSAPTEEKLEQILATIADHGAVPVVKQDCRLVAADIAGAFPEGFYSTTNQRTEIRLAGQWVEVQDQEMDCGLLVDSSGSARCRAMTDVQIGEQYVVGHAGVRVHPPERETQTHGFEFMNSPVSTEKPKGVAIRQIAQELIRTRREGGKSLLVGGPAIVHTGSDEHLCTLLRKGYIHRLSAGNALATHDIEQAIFGTSLGVRLDCGDIVEAGHEHHLRAINRIRRIGSIKQAVETGVLKSGIMYECIKNNVPFLLAGSIRDDGPLPEVITDTLEAQRQMREQIRDVTFCLVVCVDINPSTCIKLADRGSFQTVGLVTDVEPFFRSLVGEVTTLEKAS
ncbi:MAG: TIGR00300 family protein [Planctomycetales bacterium]|nr:TIGR00300 family protein [Planctomycetales bacterium]